MWLCGSIKVLEHGDTDWLLIKINLRELGQADVSCDGSGAHLPEEPYDRV